MANGPGYARCSNQRVKRPARRTGPKAASRLTTTTSVWSETAEIEGRLTYVIGVIPKRREKYLIEGRIWVDATDYALVRAEGKPARSPSFWTHSVHFVQQYQAVVTAKLWEKGTQDGKPFDYTLWLSDTYVRSPTGWRYVFGQASLPLAKTSQ